jgi:hypothetical protein
VVPTAAEEAGRDWTKVIVSDESWFAIGANVRNVWRRPHEDGPDVCCASVQHSVKALIWGAVGTNLKSRGHIVLEHQTINGEYYFEHFTLWFIGHADAAHPRTEWIFRQDNAKPHVAGEILDSLACLGVNLLPVSPRYSPDAKIIARALVIMKCMDPYREPTNRRKLCEVIEQARGDLGIETINALVAEVPQHLAAVIHRQSRTIQRLNMMHSSIDELLL